MRFTIPPNVAKSMDSRNVTDAERQYWAKVAMDPTATAQEDDPLQMHPYSGVQTHQYEDAAPSRAEESPLDTQIGGDHYKEMAIQPVEYIHANDIPFIEGCVIKYVSRWRSKGGIPDLEKARHFLDMLIELENDDMLNGGLKNAK
jgi:Protein of unknwon function (DUF3310)